MFLRIFLMGFILFANKSMAQAHAITDKLIAMAGPEACPASKNYLNKACILKVDKLYAEASTTNPIPVKGKQEAFDVLPLWEENQTANVYKVVCLPKGGVRVYVKLEDGREGFVEAANDGELEKLIVISTL